VDEEAKVRGIVHVVEEAKSYGDRGFRKRLFVLEQEDGRFPNYIPLELVKEDCELADELKVGDDIEVTYRLRGRRWQKDDRSEPKYFLNAEAREIKVIGQGAGAGAPPSRDDGDPGYGAPPADEDDDPIPF
jgi:hypothetical protein